MAAFAEPQPGLVISYSYLWSEEAERGLVEGRKDRPCAIIVAIQQPDKGQRKQVAVVPITHTHRSIRLSSGISLRHAYRYLEEAAQLKQPLEIAEPAEPITFKIPGPAIRALRSYAATHDLTLSEVVARAIKAFVARARRYG